MMPEVVLGINGYAGAGKDTLADLLVEHFGFTKLAFADPMREMAAAIDPVVGFTDDGPIRYTDAIEWHGYTDAKVMYPEVRQFLQRLGTEGGREVLGQNIWVDAAMERAQAHRRVVFSDLRFRNEAQAVKDAGGKNIHIDRPGVKAANDHPSEHDLDKWKFDLFVHNVSTPEDLIPKMEQWFSRTFVAVLRTT